MTKTIVYCDYCHKELVDENGKSVAKKMGYCVEIGFSHHGWGSRKDMIRKEAVEICTDCYSIVEAKSKELAFVIANLKNHPRKS